MTWYITDGGGGGSGLGPGTQTCSVVVGELVLADFPWVQEFRTSAPLTIASKSQVRDLIQRCTCKG
jgi:hypothetical protein